MPVVEARRLRPRRLAQLLCRRRDPGHPVRGRRQGARLGQAHQGWTPRRLDPAAPSHLPGRDRVARPDHPPTPPQTHSFSRVTGARARQCGLSCPTTLPTEPPRSACGHDRPTHAVITPGVRSHAGPGQRCGQQSKPSMQKLSSPSSLSIRGVRAEPAGVSPVQTLQVHQPRGGR